MFRFTLTVVSILLLLGCSSSPSANAKYQQSFNFNQLQTYSFFARNSQFSDFQNINDVQRNSIELAIEQVLDRNGFTYQTIDVADVVIGYYLVNHNNNELTRYNKGVKYCSFCLNTYTSDTGKKSLSAKSGSLIVDLVDPISKRSVWRSVYQLNIKQKDNSKDIQDKIFNAISLMIRQLPSNNISSVSLDNNIS